MIQAVLPGGRSAAVPWSDPELRKLCAALWRDFVDLLTKAGCVDLNAAPSNPPSIQSKQK
eukprot:6152457-Amphidinium_carterae.1